MAEDLTPCQSGNLDNRFGIHGPGSSSLEPMSVDRSKLPHEAGELYLLPDEIDEIRRHIKNAWRSAILKNIGPLPPEALEVLNEFKAVEKGAKTMDPNSNIGETIHPKIFDFAAWLNNTTAEKLDHSPMVLRR